MKIIMANFKDECSVTYLLGQFPENTQYCDLVKIFGEPNGETDHNKIDAKWIGKIDGDIFTVYNYESGKNYLGINGQNVNDITNWHIGGKNRNLITKIIDFFISETGTYKTIHRPHWKHLLQICYLKQCGEELTEQSIIDYGLDDNNMTLLFKNDDIYVIDYQSDFNVKFINVIDRKNEILYTI